MAEFVLAASSTADLPEWYCKEHDITLLPYTFNIDDRDCLDNFEKDMTNADFYRLMREGCTATTSMLHPETYKSFFRTLMQSGKDVLFIEFSSALTSSCTNAFFAAEEVNKEFSNTLYISDSVSACTGYGLLVHYAAKKRDEGLSAKEAFEWVEEHKRNMIHWFTVDDLEYLRRGGRVSNTAAFMGGMLKIKPVLNVNDKGELIPVSKVRGRKKAILEMLENMKQDITEPAGQTVFISHCDCLEDAEFLRDRIKETFPEITDYVIHYIGPVIGAHVGPGCLALFYYGSKRA